MSDTVPSEEERNTSAVVQLVLYVPLALLEMLVFAEVGTYIWSTFLVDTVGFSIPFAAWMGINLMWRLVETYRKPVPEEAKPWSFLRAVFIRTLAYGLIVVSAGAAALATTGTL